MGKKSPKSNYNPKTEKRPKHLDVYLDDKKIFWSFAIYDPDLNFPTSGKPNASFCEIASAIKTCEKRTWSDIDSHPGRDHPIDCYKLEKFARDRLVELSLDDNDSLWSVHFDGVCRLWGIRNGSLMQILWLDMLHEVYLVYKKHT